MSRLRALETLLTACAPLGVLGTQPYSIAYAPRFTLPQDRTNRWEVQSHRADRGAVRRITLSLLTDPTELLDHHYPTERGRHQ